MKASFSLSTITQNYSDHLRYLVVLAWWLAVFSLVIALADVMGIPLIGLTLCLAVIYLGAFIGNTAFFIGIGQKHMVDLLDAGHQKLACLILSTKNEAADSNPTSDSNSLPELIARFLTLALFGVLGYVSATLITQQMRIQMLQAMSIDINWLVAISLPLLLISSLLWWHLETRPEVATCESASSATQTSTTPEDRYPKTTYYRSMAYASICLNIFMNFLAQWAIGFFTDMPLYLAITCALAYTFGSLTAGRHHILSFFGRWEKEQRASPENKPDTKPLSVRAYRYLSHFVFVLSNRTGVLLLPLLLMWIGYHCPPTMVGMVAGVVLMGAIIALCRCQPENRQATLTYLAPLTLLMLLLLAMTYLPLGNTTIIALTVVLYISTCITSTLLLYDINQDRDEGMLATTLSNPENHSTAPESTVTKTAEKTIPPSETKAFPQITGMAHTACSTLTAFTMTAAFLLLLLSHDSAFYQGVAQTSGCDGQDALDSWWMPLLVMLLAVVIGYNLYEVFDKKNPQLADHLRGIKDSISNAIFQK